MIEHTKLELPELPPVPALELSQFRPGERAVLERTCENYAKLYARAAQVLALERAALECDNLPDPSRGGWKRSGAVACAAAIRALKEKM
jgi:hypothetical protein